jgi:hypothetical protein
LFAEQADSTDLRRGLSASDNKVGDVLIAQVDLAGVLKSCRACVVTAACSAKSDPGNALWQSDLVISCEKLPYVHAHSERLTKQHAALDAKRAISAKLVADRVEIVRWKKDRAWFDTQIAAMDM